MEHRWSRRVELRGDVVLGHLQYGLIRGALNNISLGGMFVEARGIPFQMNAPVMVSFELERAGQKYQYRLPALVVRTADHGVGLMYLDAPMQTLRDLREVLYGGEEIQDFGAQPLSSPVSAESGPSPGAGRGMERLH